MEGEMTIHEAVIHHRLDKRRKYFAYCGVVSTTVWATIECTGCIGSGCNECGYHGKVRSPFPNFIIETNGNTIPVTDKDFTNFKK